MNYDEILFQRREALAKSIRLVDIEEASALGEQLFPHLDDPWRQQFFSFLKENPIASYYHATALDDVQVLFTRPANQGIWFIPGKGVGILQERGIRVLAELAAGVG